MVHPIETPGSGPSLYRDTACTPSAVVWWSRATSSGRDCTMPIAESSHTSSMPSRGQSDAPSPAPESIDEIRQNESTLLAVGTCDGVWPDT